MSDIVERLREGIFGSTETKTDVVINAYMHEGADEIEKLRAAMHDLAAHVWRGDWNKLRPETRAALGEKE